LRERQQWKRQRLEKLDERRALRDDSYRTDLRLAYARFIASYSRLLTVGEQLQAPSRTLHKQRESDEIHALEAGAVCDDADDVYLAAGEPALIERVRLFVEHFTDTAVETNARLAEVMLLESYPPMQDRLLAIFESPLVALSGSKPDDYDRFAADIRVRKTLLDGLTRALTGMFTEQRWIARTSAPKAELAGESAPRLPAGKPP